MIAIARDADFNLPRSSAALRVSCDKATESAPFNDDGAQLALPAARRRLSVSSWIAGTVLLGVILVAWRCLGEFDGEG